LLFTDSFYRFQPFFLDSGTGKQESRKLGKLREQESRKLGKLRETGGTEGTEGTGKGDKMEKKRREKTQEDEKILACLTAKCRTLLRIIQGRFVEQEAFVRKFTPLVTRWL